MYYTSTSLPIMNRSTTMNQPPTHTPPSAHTAQADNSPPRHTPPKSPAATPMEQNKFINRYLRFWRHFNPGRSEPKGLLVTAFNYYELLVSEGVNYEFVDRICTNLQKEQKRISSFDGFNLVAYLLDCWRSERSERLQQQTIFEARPINLPKKGVPIDLDSAPEWMVKCLEKLKRNKLFNWITLLERINARRQAGSETVNFGPHCWACNDTGWVDIPGANGVGTCICAKGQKIRTKDGERIELGIGQNGKRLVVAQATPEDCRLAAAKARGRVQREYEQDKHE